MQFPSASCVEDSVANHWEFERLFLGENWTAKFQSGFKFHTGDWHIHVYVYTICCANRLYINVCI